MTYQVLARKWRPQTFTELVGQDTTLSALVHSLNNNQLHHAYLFTGTRGVGKTTVARIMAKCLNCEEAISAMPCGKCSACLEIQEGRFIDLIEIDAASRTKVEDTREILDNVPYAPSKGRFKVYLIDEVHMLSAHSFNALLKTLEEPPPHVKFLLATTDPQKLPVTVLSRCLQFHLKHIPQDLIVKRLQFILETEKIAFEPEALPLIAKAAEGSLRDALSLLDQAISQGEGLVKRDTTATMLGLTRTELLYALAGAIAMQNTEQLYQLMKDFERQPLDYKAILSLLAELWYEVSLKQIIPPYQSLSWDNGEILKLAGLASPTLVQLFYQMALQGCKDLPFSPQPSIGFNMTLLRMLAFLREEPDVGHQKKQVLSHSVTAKLAIATSERERPEPCDVSSAITEQQSDAINNCPTTRQQFDPESWKAVSFELTLGGLTKQLIRHMRFDKQVDSTLHLSLGSEYQNLLTEKRIEDIQAALKAHCNHSFLLQISVTTAPIESPASQYQDALEISKKQLQDKLDQDPHLSFIKNNFNGKISEVKSNQTTSIT